MNIRIRRARPDEAAALTEIAHAAKRYWGYPENWIEHWRGELTITPDFIANNEMYVAVAGDEIAGCCALVLSDSQAELEHMWIRPEHMGNGVGRALFQQVVERATHRKATGLEISSDPNAEGFYQRMGAKRVGEVRSDIEGQPRVLPRMSVNLIPPLPVGEGTGKRARMRENEVMNLFTTRPSPQPSPRGKGRSSPRI